MKPCQWLVGAILALSGLLLGLSLVTNVQASAEAKWWDLFTAFGTVGSALTAMWTGRVALKLSRQTQEEQSRERMSRGLIIAGIVKPECQRLVYGVTFRSESVLYPLIEKFSKESGSSVDFRKDAENLENLISDCQLIETNKVFDSLHFLSEGRGKNAASAIGVLGQLSRKVEQAAETLRKGTSDDAARLLQLLAIETLVGQLVRELMEVVDIPKGYLLWPTLERLLQAAARGDIALGLLKDVQVSHDTD